MHLLHQNTLQHIFLNVLLNFTTQSQNKHCMRRDLQKYTHIYRVSNIYLLCSVGNSWIKLYFSLDPDRGPLVDDGACRESTASICQSQQYISVPHSFYYYQNVLINLNAFLRTSRSNWAVHGFHNDWFQHIYAELLFNQVSYSSPILDWDPGICQSWMLTGRFIATLR